MSVKNKTTKKTKKSSTVETIDENIQEQEEIINEAVPPQKETTLETHVETSFFYTSDKIINSFDNDEIIKRIRIKFKNLTINNSDTLIKKSIVQFLADENFVEFILNYYNITILELFKILYVQFGSVFKGPYLKKIRKEIQDKKYADIKRRKQKY